MKKITLKGDWESREVWLNGKPLSPIRSQAVYNHSPDGFAWSYGGSGPAQLALAILLEICPEEIAKEKYQDFKWEHIATLPEGSFEKEITLNF